MACEDSSSFDRCLDRSARHSTCLRVHRVRDVHDLEQSVRCEMVAIAHLRQYGLERLQGFSLDHEVPVTKRDDSVSEALEVSYDVLQRAILASRFRVRRDRAAAQALFQRAQDWF